VTNATVAAGDYFVSLTSNATAQAILGRSIMTSAAVWSVTVPAAWHVWSVDATASSTYVLATPAADMHVTSTGAWATTAQVLQVSVSATAFTPVGPALSMGSAAAPLAQGPLALDGAYRSLFVRPDGATAAVLVGSGYVLVDLQSPDGLVVRHLGAGLANVLGWGPAPNELLVEAADGYGITQNHSIVGLSASTGHVHPVIGMPAQVCTAAASGGVAYVITRCLRGGGSLLRVDSSGAHAVRTYPPGAFSVVLGVNGISVDGRTMQVAPQGPCAGDMWTIDLPTGRETLRVGDGVDLGCQDLPVSPELPL
jgi:hypothetical protein